MNRFLLFAILILMTAACSRHETRVAAAGAERKAAAVQVETVAASEIADIYQASGSVRARYSAAIAAKITANILDVRVQTGDHVQAGQTLIALDRRDLEAHLRRSEAARAEAESAIDETESAITAARANFELVRVTHKRFQDLLAKASVSQQEFDESQTRLRSAEAALEMAASKRRQVEARRSQAEAEIAAALWPSAMPRLPRHSQPWSPNAKPIPAAWPRLARRCSLSSAKGTRAWRLRSTNLG